MDTLRDTVSRVVAAYAGEALNGQSYFTQSEDGQVLTVVGHGTFSGKHIAALGLFVRIVDDQVIIEWDANDKPLVDALLQAGVLRSQIVLAYAGERVRASV